MRRKIFFFFIFLSFALSPASYAQQKDVKKDSAGVYRKIETFSKKNKVSYFFYREVFNALPSNTPPSQISDVKKEIIREEYYSRFEGKIIRNIEITSYDPFGYNDKDTTISPHSLLQKSGNALHIKSVHRTIKKLLIIKKNDPFDSLRVRESERLIRSQGFVHEVAFRPVLTTKNSDSVDIYIRVYDLWSIIANTKVSPSSFSLDLKDKNFLGLGNQFQNIYSRDYNSGAIAYQTNYSISNIRNTYISTSLHYDINEHNYYNRSLSIDRPFYSAFTKWAGGIYFSQHMYKNTLYYPDSTAVYQNYRYNTQDYWAGKAWQILKGHTENARTTSLILSTRYLQTSYQEKPLPYFDSLNLFGKQTFYLAEIGVSRRRYDPDRYIFKYGTTEDVPVGRAYSVVSGYEIKNNKARNYLGARIYWGQYYHCGYFSSNIEYGTFLYASRLEEGSLTAGINYFTHIITIGKWRLRQFIKSQYIIGFNRLASDNLSINNELGISGFSSSGLTGNSEKIVLTLQTQSYAPWNVKGFHFGPYAVCSFGMLSTAASGFSNSRVYSQYGIGFLIRNEYLIFSSIQISAAFYPTIPGDGNNVFKINPVKSTDFGFRDFDITKPSTVAYH
jgi:hypothetical protein